MIAIDKLEEDGYSPYEIHDIQTKWLFIRIYQMSKEIDKKMSVREKHEAVQKIIRDFFDV